MNRDDWNEFVTAFGGMCVMYDKDPSDVLLQGYWRSLQDFTIDQVKTAITTAIQTCEFFPKPARLRQILTGKALDRALVAWGKVYGAIQEHGSYASVAFEDPGIHIVIDTMGGWPAVCEAADNEWTAKRFTQIYQANGDGEPRECYLIAPHLAGRFELEGQRVEPKLIGDATKIRRWQQLLPAPKTRKLLEAVEEVSGGGAK